jgi:hypothetical protein
LRIAQVAPPLEAVPPIGYGGTERIVGELVLELDRRGHRVTTFASGDSQVPGTLVATVPRALRPIGFADDPMPSFRTIVELVLERQGEFDLIHATSIDGTWSWRGGNPGVDVHGASTCRGRATRSAAASRLVDRATRRASIRTWTGRSSTMA